MWKRADTAEEQFAQPDACRNFVERRRDACPRCSEDVRSSPIPLKSTDSSHMFCKFIQILDCVRCLESQSSDELARGSGRAGQGCESLSDPDLRRVAAAASISVRVGPLPLTVNRKQHRATLLHPWQFSTIVPLVPRTQTDQCYGAHLSSPDALASP